MALPEAILDQDRLLTIHTESEPVVIDGLPGVDVWPLYLDPESGTWVVRARFKPGTVLPKHFHTGKVHFYTLAGSWSYVEYPDDIQVAGSYLYEPGGSIHTFSTEEGAEGFMVVEGANVNFVGDEFLNIMDAGWIERMLIQVADAQGIRPRYIKPGSATYSVIN